MTENKPLTRTQWYVLIAAFLGWMFDGLEMGLFPLAARPALRSMMKIGGEFPAEAEVGWWYSILVAMFLLGAAAGGLLFGWLGDRLGRVRTMALSIAVYAGFTGLCVFATAPWHLAALRFCAAIGMGGEWALGVALVMECWPEKFRPLLAGTIGAAANFGFLAISVFAVVSAVDEESWRTAMIVGAAPGILAFFVLVLIPESERWKESVKAGASKPLREIFTTDLAKPALLGIAFASVALIGTWGAVSGFLPPWTDKLVGGDRVLTITATLRSDAAPLTLKDIETLGDPKVSDALAENSSNESFDTKPIEPGEDDASEAATDDDADPKPNYEIARSPVIRKGVEPGKKFKYKVRVTNKGNKDGARVTLTDRLPEGRIDLASVSFDEKNQDNVSFDKQEGNLTWTIGDLEYKDPHAKGWIQVMLSIGAIIGCYLGSLLGNWLGRRPAYFLLCTLSLLSCAYLFRGLDEYNTWFVIVTVFVGLVTASFYGWLPLYLPELFPTRVRATGQGIAFNSGRVFAAVGALTTGQLMLAFDGSYPKACATITLVYLVGMVLIWFAPETKGKPLPE